MTSSYFYFAALGLVALIVAYIYFWVWAFRKYPHQTTNRVCVGALVVGVFGHLAPKPEGEGSAILEIFGVRTTEPIKLSFRSVSDEVVLGIFIIIALISVICLIKLPAER